MGRLQHSVRMKIVRRGDDMCDAAVVLCWATKAGFGVGLHSPVSGVLVCLHVTLAVRPAALTLSL